MRITKDSLVLLKEWIKKEWNYKEGIYKGYKYKILRHKNLGQLNWYILLPKTHKYYWKDYDDINIKVHWWLTYSWQEKDYWKIGFDCWHCDDLCPYVIESLMNGENYIDYSDWTYKDIKFVKAECKRLIGQLQMNWFDKLKYLLFKKLK